MAEEVKDVKPIKLDQEQSQNDEMGFEVAEDKEPLCLEEGEEAEE